MDSPLDTIAAIATPLGEGGIGVIRLSGSQAVAIANKLFHPAKPVDLTSAPSHTCYFGNIIEPSPALRAPSPRGRGPTDMPDLLPMGEGGQRPDEGGQRVDQVVLTLFRAPHSYTGEDVVEISAHGSPFVLQQILRLCIRHGARLAGPGEFTQRAFLSGKLDLTQAEAVADLIRAKTDKAQAAALAQLEGRLAAKVRDLREAILPLLAHVEVGLDHSDEDHDFLKSGDLTARCADIRAQISEILDSARVGKILREGLRVALVGRPNVGKSSLLNALLKEDRAIVTPNPGTTRDTLEETVNWDGLPVVLTDTAGLREKAGDPVEHIGMERSRQALEGSDLVLALFDGSEPLMEEDRQVMALVEDRPHLRVINKCDLPEQWEGLPSSGLRPPSPRGRRPTAVDPLPMGEGARRAGEGVAVAEREPDMVVVRLSAKTGEGLMALVQAVKQFALQEKASAGEAQWLLNARHREALARADEALTEACEAAKRDAFEECVALELKTALQALGEIIGETATEDLLDQIFSTFCIGK